MDHNNKLLNIQNTAVSMILDTKTLEELNEVKLQFIGRSGQLTLTMKEITTIDKEHRKDFGQLCNEVKQTIEETIESHAQSLQTKAHTVRKQTLDITNPGIKPSLGHLHLITQAIDEITSIFEKIGFSRVRHPEVEWDWFAFTALNFPDNHPARDDWETFFTTEDTHPDHGSMILTPHTSSGQIREMHKGKVPIRMLNIAKTYRRQSDISHTQMFHQFEGLVVGDDISIVHLKGVLDYFVKSYFGDTRITRLRPYHFQFTEPSFEIDISCGVCAGKGILESGEKCKLCKGGWLELGGAGMVHPNVLKAGGIDPEKHTGFAFGWGVERVLMMKEGLVIDDLRLLYSNKLEFLEQF